MIKAKYTVVLKSLMDDELTMNKINQAMSTYPLYEKKSKEEYIPSYIPTRDELNKKLLNRYKYREIGFETVGRFLDELEIALNEIMPYYNQLFYTIDMDYDILFNVNYTREIEVDKTGTNENKSTGNGKTTNESATSGTTESSGTDTGTTEGHIDNYNKHVNSKTPQSELSIGTTDINNVSYADEVSFNHDHDTESSSSTNTATSNIKNNGTENSSSNSESNVNSTGTNTEKEKHIEITKGNYGQVTYQSLLKAYRELILNVEQKLINDHRIRELFMQVY